VYFIPPKLMPFFVRRDLLLSIFGTHKSTNKLFFILPGLKESDQNYWKKQIIQCNHQTDLNIRDDL
jgi:hypothetical protein